ncbi:MCP four helix bundle domain-containing protein, partial [Rhizobium puerariae]
MRFTIKLKLGLAFGLIITLLVITAGYGIYSLSHLNQAISDLIAGPAARLELVQNFANAQLRLARSQMNIATSDSAEDVQKYIQGGDRNRDLFRDTLKKLQEASTTEEAKQSWRAVEDRAEQLFRVDDAIREAARSGNNDEALRLAKGDGRAMMDEIEKTIQVRVEANKALMVQADEDTNNQYNTTRNLIIGIAAIALVAAVIAALWIALGISRGLAKIMGAANAVAIGDLNQNVEIKTNDEIKDLVDTINVMTANLRNTANIADQIANGDLTVSPKPLSDKDTLGLALESMVERLRGVVGDALAAADNVSSGSQELSASSEQLSQGATEQASSA